METIHDLAALPPLPKGAVVTIGNFDGVHLAHAQLLQRVVEVADRGTRTPAVITFDPHPIRVLAPERAPQLLTSLAERARLIEQRGIKLLVVLRFTRELAHFSPEEFVRQILVARLSAACVIVGPNFRFGYRQAGDVHTLAELGRRNGFSVELLSSVQMRGQPVSSTRIRNLLSEGKVNAAARLLGRPFSNSGPIVSGLGIGHRHTVPTLNLSPVEEQLPAIGVYVTRTRLGEASHESVTNVGRRPTFGERHITVETYLLNFKGEVREAQMSVEYLYRLRDEIKFQNPALLKIQIQEDARRSLKFFRLLGKTGRS
ncbi:MAG TPA: bifunctional riboflavin kinase/FAD synthetase [Terriglobia bacterium]|nr:bifunctional riboflavin kinase/FAD synthetase [Terriglobia bacterium]